MSIGDLPVAKKLAEIAADKNRRRTRAENLAYATRARQTARTQCDVCGDR